MADFEEPARSGPELIYGAVDENGAHANVGLAGRTETDDGYAGGRVADVYFESGTWVDPVTGETTKGVEIGGGLGQLRAGNGDQSLNIDLLTARAGATQTDDGSTIGGEANLFKYQQDYGAIDFTAGVGNAYANATFTEDVTGIGAGAIAYQAYGHYADPDPTRSDDTSIGFGLSAGPSAGARHHHSDDDKDEIRELGVGFDAGPVSFDFKSEVLGELAGDGGPKGPTMHPFELYLAKKNPNYKKGDPLPPPESEEEPEWWEFWKGPDNGPTFSDYLAKKSPNYEPPPDE